jgi:hypothetical protein
VTGSFVLFPLSLMNVFFPILLCDILDIEHRSSFRFTNVTVEIAASFACLRFRTVNTTVKIFFPECVPSPFALFFSLGLSVLMQVLHLVM